MRVRDEISGKYAMEEHCKIYEQVKGEYKFKESTKNEVRSSAVIDDGRFHFKENQAQQVFEDHTAAFFDNNNTGRQRLLAADVGQSSSSSAVVAVPKAKAKAKAKAVDTEDFIG